MPTKPTDETTVRRGAEIPRTPEGRLWANYRRRLAEARLAATASDEPPALDRMTPAMAAVDEAYVSGALVRSMDREVRRLRALCRREAA